MAAKRSRNGDLAVPVVAGDYVHIAVHPNGSTSVSVDPAVKRTSHWRFSGCVSTSGVLRIGANGLPEIKRQRITPVLVSTATSSTTGTTGNDDVAADSDDTTSGDDSDDKEAGEGGQPIMPGQFLLLTYDATGSHDITPVPFDLQDEDDEYEPAASEHIGVFWCQEAPPVEEEGPLLGFWLQHKSEWSAGTTKRFKAVCAPDPVPRFAFVDEYSEVTSADVEGIVPYTECNERLTWTNERNQTRTFPPAGTRGHMLPAPGCATAVATGVTWDEMLRVARAQVQAFSFTGAPTRRHEAIRRATPLTSAAAVKALHQTLF